MRDASDTSKYTFLTTLPGASDRLELVSADLNQPDTFLAAVEGCDYVLHVASPYTLKVDDPMRDLIHPAVNGTTAVLRACDAAVHPVRRIVLTSSMAAVTDEPVNGHVYTEADWNTLSHAGRNPYYASKVQAERAAWAHVEGRGVGGATAADGGAVGRVPEWELVTMNPFAVVGPSIVPTQSTTNGTVESICKGGFPLIMGVNFGYTDVRDVATAHIAAMTSQHATGRYLLNTQAVTLRRLVQELRELGLHGDGYALPTMGFDGACGVCCTRNCLAYTESGGTRDFLQTNPGRTLTADCTKARYELGWVPTPWETTLRDTVAAMVVQGHLPACDAPALQSANAPDAEQWGRPQQTSPRSIPGDVQEERVARARDSTPVPAAGASGCCGCCK